MVRDNVQILLELYYRPLRALGSILDRGSVLFAVFAAVAINLLVGVVMSGLVDRIPPDPAFRQPAATLQEAQQRQLDDDAIAQINGGPLRQFRVPGGPLIYDSPSPVSAVSTLIPLAVFFVPVAVIITAWWEGLGGAGVVLRRDYMPMLACALMTWAASNALVALAAMAVGALGGATLPAMVPVMLYGFGQCVFLAYSMGSIRTVMGARWGHAVCVALAAWITMTVGRFAYGAFGNGSFYLASPFVLYYAYIMLNQDIRLLSGGLSSRQSMRRHLEACTLNPRDYDAHYQLGLIYQQRRNYPEAIARFEKAIEIEPKEEADAYYQLGRIAREQKRLEDARRYFAATIAINDKHSSSEPWRDLGATDFELGHLDQALPELQKYADRRSYDPEGLYWLGMTLKKLSRTQDAREAFERAIDAARTSPTHRRRQVGKWGGQAQAELRSLPKS